MNCTLCKSILEQVFFSEKEHCFYKCPVCGAVLRDQKTFLDRKMEKARYKTHNNDVNDLRYQEFVSPITDEVQKYFSPWSSLGLDFGAGPGPVITKVLTDAGYNLNLYDPFFHQDKSVLELRYDYIICCEVIEHFHYPRKEFQLLKTLLKPGGKLFCMTHILSPETDFASWYYKNDPTHVMFYTENSLRWIQQAFGFQGVYIDNRLIVFEK